MNSKNKIGWKFYNSYLQLPKDMLSKQIPEKAKNPKIVLINHGLSEELGINISDLDEAYLASVFSGNQLPDGSDTIAMAYAGHQFGHFTILGDGRAILLGDHINRKKQRYEIQLKGAGKTEFSRNGDGKAALGPMIREYIMSEAMYYLNIPTTRSLAVVKTDEKVIREKDLVRNKIPNSIISTIPNKAPKGKYCRKPSLNFTKFISSIITTNKKSTATAPT